MVGHEVAAGRGELPSDRAAILWRVGPSLRGDGGGGRRAQDPGSGRIPPLKGL